MGAPRPSFPARAPHSQAGAGVPPPAHCTAGRMNRRDAEPLAGAAGRPVQGDDRIHARSPDTAWRKGSLLAADTGQPHGLPHPGRPGTDTALAQAQKPGQRVTQRACGLTSQRVLAGGPGLALRASLTCAVGPRATAVTGALPHSAQESLMDRRRAKALNHPLRCEHKAWDAGSPTPVSSSVIFAFGRLRTERIATRQELYTGHSLLSSQHLPGGRAHPNSQTGLGEARDLLRSQLVRDKLRFAETTRNSAFCKFRPQPQATQVGRPHMAPSTDSDPMGAAPDPGFRGWEVAAGRTRSGVATSRGRALLGLVAAGSFPAEQAKPRDVAPLGRASGDGQSH